MKILERILKFGLLTSGIQIGCYTLLLYISKFLQNLFLTENHKEIFSNYAIVLSIIIFSMIVVIQNLTTAAINNKWFAIIAFALAAIFYIIGWGENINSWPYKTILSLIIGLTVLGSKFFIDKRLNSY